MDFQYHKEVMEIKDARATQLNEIIQGITIIKFFTWEQKFIKTIEEIRFESDLYCYSLCIYIY